MNRKFDIDILEEVQIRTLSEFDGLGEGPPTIVPYQIHTQH